MLIGNVLLTESGIALYDMDGSHVKVNAEQALDLEIWLKAHHAALIEIMRRQQQKAQEKTMDTDRGDEE